ncbi:HGxxPAAW family protein [Arthrobacter sp. JSM 101049]|uniref:HGxxPAAW family protein n=1 Tax=Arthrobacter sp. JSM 101049 TaxID=929097 RepID=UPI00356518D3
MASNATAQNAQGLDPVLSEPVGHGNSVAAWTAVAIMLIGSLVSCIAFALHAPIGVYIGIAVIIVGLIVGGVMRKAGFGVGGHRSNNDGH